MATLYVVLGAAWFPGRDDNDDYAQVKSHDWIAGIFRDEIEAEGFRKEVEEKSGDFVNANTNLRFFNEGVKRPEVSYKEDKQMGETLQAEFDVAFAALKVLDPKFDDGSDPIDLEMERYSYNYSVIAGEEKGWFPAIP